MLDNLAQILDILTVAPQLIGKTKTVIFDSGIYKHCFGLDNDIDGHIDPKNNVDSRIDLKNDIHKLRGTKETPITIEDILDMFEKMQKQFIRLNKYGYEKNYYYVGIYGHPNSKKRGIEWGTI
jgi:hypothetical protein